MDRCERYKASADDAPELANEQALSVAPARVGERDKPEFHIHGTGGERGAVSPVRALRIGDLPPYLKGRSLVIVEGAWRSQPCDSPHLISSRRAACSRDCDSGAPATPAFVIRWTVIQFTSCARRAVVSGAQ